MRRYQDIEYSYTASNSSVSRGHWLDFVDFLNSKVDLSDASILEIGSNDGYLLSLLSNRVSKFLGVDASPFMAKLSKSRGIPCLSGIFGEDEYLTSNITKTNASFNLIIANNVLNHSNNPIKFLQLVSDLLHQDGLFVFEVPYWYSTVVSGRFDQIYLEHITYLTANSIKTMLEKCGLFLNDIDVVDYHGGSLRVQASKNRRVNSARLEKLQKQEIDERLNSQERYFEYMHSVRKRKDLARNSIMELHRLGREVFGIGAAAKANTLLTYFEITKEEMPFIVDTSPYKIGKITPKTLIPIFHDDEVKSLKYGTGLMLAWNLSTVVMQKLLEINPRLEFLEV
jgi:SAM-dependent methyltransferase